MKANFNLALLVLLVIFCSCHKKNITKTEVSVNDVKPNFLVTETKNVIVDAALDPNTISGALTTIDSIYIIGDILTIQVEYSGGCQTHDFDLYSNGMYAKSLPPQLTLYLKHNNHDDKCRELVMKDLKFNIASTKYAFGKIIKLKLADKEVQYSYN